MPKDMAGGLTIMLIFKLVHDVHYVLQQRS
jgi:hypothetical protein